METVFSLYLIPDYVYLIGYLNAYILADMTPLNFITLPWLSVIFRQLNKKNLEVQSLLFFEDYSEMFDYLIVNT